MQRIDVLRLPVLCVVLLLSFAEVASSQTVDWIRQLGSTSWYTYITPNDRGNGVSVDGLGNIYITGTSNGTFVGGYHDSRDDAFVSKYSPDGTQQWIRSLDVGGAYDHSFSSGISADTLGNAYITGYTRDSAAFASKLDTEGNLQWTRYWGSDSSGTVGSDVSADGFGNVYISGSTWQSGGVNDQATIFKYDADGNLQWSREIGTTANDYSSGVSADGLGNVYLTGYTGGGLDGASNGRNDAFLSKYASDGNLEWTRQLGTSAEDFSTAVAADGLGNVYMSGYTAGSLDGLNRGQNDAFLSKYSSSGDLEWTRQIGSSAADRSNGVFADRKGNVYISGSTSGGLDGSNLGQSDAFVSKYNPSGVLQWTRQIGSSAGDSSNGVSSDGEGNVYISGATSGALDGPNRGGRDAFAAKIIDEGFELPPSSIVFREMRNLDSWFLPKSVEDFLDIPGLDHVAVNVDGKIYESQFAVNTGTYRDVRNRLSLTGAVVVPETLRGVIQAHTIHTFRHNSTTEESDVEQVIEIPIPQSVAHEMERVIRSVQGAPYPYVYDGLAGFIFDPEVQKGARGTYSCVGIVEWAAEQIGTLFPEETMLHGSEGFVPDEWETIPAFRLVKADGSEIASPFPTINALTPNLVHYVLTNPELSTLTNEQIFRAAFDPVDFLITDPLGRRLGHTTELGTINEIPLAFYNGDGALEEVFIPNALPGQYRVTFFGADDDVFAAVGSLTDGFVFDEFLASTQSFTSTISVNLVPEPSTLFAASILAWTAVCYRPYRSTKHEKL